MEQRIQQYEDQGVQVRRAVYRKFGILPTAPRVYHFPLRGGFDGGRLVAIVEAAQEQRPLQLYAAMSRLSHPVQMLLSAIVNGATLDEAAGEAGLTERLEEVVPRLREWLRPYIR